MDDLSHKKSISGKASVVTAESNYVRVTKTHTSVIATLCARDYKGFGSTTECMNNVIEINEDNNE